MKFLNVLKAKYLAVLSVGVLTLSGAHAAGELVTTGENGVVTVNPDALVAPVRSAIVDSITSASSIFIIVIAVGVVIYFIHRFKKG